MSNSRSYRLYHGQIQSSLKRGIPFNLTYQEWFSWWLFNGINKDDPIIPFNKDSLCMCRYNDTGPYELGNIYCDTNSNNVSLRNKLYHKSEVPYELVTPHGTFKSCLDASKVLGVHVNTIHYRKSKYPNEWYFTKF